MLDPSYDPLISLSLLSVMANTLLNFFEDVYTALRQKHNRLKSVITKFNEDQPLEQLVAGRD